MVIVVGDILLLFEISIWFILFSSSLSFFLIIFIVLYLYLIVYQTVRGSRLFVQLQAVWWPVDKAVIVESNMDYFHL
ncbi:hypothetical protein Q6325_29150, partial [Klebsiella pneumoniae]|nr:hypothetical protein [Klebsiella pneumoniae]